MRDSVKRFIRSKILLIAIALFSIALIGCALFIRSDAFMNWVKHRVEAEIRNRITDTYTVNIGKITGNVLTGVKVENVAVFPSGGTPDAPVLSLQRLVLKYNLFALLFRKVEVTALEMSQPRLHAEVDAAGKLNLTQLFKTADTPQSVARGPVPRDSSDNRASAWTFAVQRVRCSDGTLRFLDRQRNLDIAIAGVTLDFQGPLNTWNHQGTFSVSDGSVAFNGAKTAITQFDADFLVVASGGELTQFRLNVGNSVLEATGNYSSASSRKTAPRATVKENATWRANITVQVDAADVQKFAGDMPHIEGIASLHVTTEGTSDTASGTLTATVPSLTIAGLSEHFTPTGGTLQLRDVAVDADFNTHPVLTFSLNRLQMHIAEGLFQASAHVKRDIYEGAWHATGIQLAAIPPMEPFSNWEGNVSTAGTFSGKGTDISTLRLDSTLGVTDTLLNGTSVADSRLTGTLAAPSLWAVEKWRRTGSRDAVKSESSNRAYGRSSELTVSGTLAEADVHLGGFLGEELHIRASSLRMDKLMGIFGGGPLNGLGKLTADISPAGTMKGHLEIPEATFMDIPLGVLVGDFRYQDEQVFVENGLLTKGESRVAIEGTVGMEGELPAQLRIVAEPCQVAEYRQLLFGNVEYDISGLVTGELLCDGSLSRLDGKGTFAVTEGIAWGMRLDELTLPLAMEDYAITIPDFQISARGQQVTLNLALATSGDFTLDIRNHAPVQLAELVRAADVADFPIDANMDIAAIGIQGAAQIEEPRETGPRPAAQKFTFDVDITLADITYEGNPLTDATLHGTLVERKKTTGEPDIFQFIGEAFEGASQITGEISTATDSPYYFTVQSRAMPATPILRCLHPMLEVVTGTADSTVEITGTLAALSPKVTALLPANEKPVYPYDVDIAIDTTALLYRDIPITNPEPMRLHLENDVWTFVDFRLAAQAESSDILETSPFVELTGTFSARDEAMDIVAKSAGFSIEPLGTAFGFAIDGTARYEMAMNGTVLAPKLALKLAVPALQMQTEFGDILVSTADTGAQVRYENNTVQINPFALQISGNTVNVGGNIAVIPEDVNASQLNVNVRAQQLVLANYEHLIRKNLPPETIALLMGQDSDGQLIDGTLNLSLELTGSLAEPIMKLIAFAAENRAIDSPHYPGNPGNLENPAQIRIGAFPKPILLDALQASVTFPQETVRIGDIDAKWRIADATYHAHGNASFPGRRALPGSNPQFAFTISANQLEVADFAALFLKQAEPSIHGTLSTVVAITGTGMLPEQFSATCEITSLSVISGSLYFLNSDTALTVASRYGALEGKFAFQLASPLLAGSVNATIGGTHSAPEITATGDGNLHHLKWLGAVDYRDEQITVHRVELASREKKTLTLTGSIPFNLALTSVPVAQRFLEKPMAVHLRGQELPLAFFPKADTVFYLSEPVARGPVPRELSGSQAVVDINIGIVGTTRAPHLSGSVSMLAPHLRLKDFPEPLRNATLHLTASEKGIESHNFRFEVGNRLNGACIGQRAHVMLDGLTPKSFTLTGFHLHQFPLGALARQAVPPEIITEVSGHVTATLSACQIPLDSFFTEAIPGVSFPQLSRALSLTALAEVATASAEIEDVQFAFNAVVTASGAPLRYDLRNTEPVPVVLEGGSARLLKEFLMKDFSYRNSDAAGEQPLFRIKGDFSAQLNEGRLPPALQAQLQERVPMETYNLKKRDDLWRISGTDTNAPAFWLRQRVKADEQSNGRIQLFEESPAIGVDREAAFGLKADFSRALNDGTVPAALRSALQSRGFILPETLHVSKIDTLWQVQEEETKHRWTLIQEDASLSVFEHSLQFSLDKGSEIQVEVCDIAARVKNFDVSPLTVDWPAQYRIKGTLSASLHVGNTSGVPQITLRRKKPSTRTHLDGIHLNGVPIELNGRLRYREGAWEISKNRQLTTILGPTENTLTCSLRVETSLASHTFWEQLFRAPAHLLTGTLTGELNVQAKNFGPLQFMVPTVSSASGESELYAALTGTLDSPKIEGKVTFKNLALELEEAGVSLREAEGEFRLSNSQLAVTRFGSILNGGYLSVAGDVFLWATDERIWNPAEPTLALEATLANATFAQPGQYQVDVDAATLQIDGPLSSPLLTGSVDIETGEYRQNWENVREWFAGTSVTETEVILDESPLRELQLDVNINVPSFYLLSSVTGPTDIHIACDGILTGLIQAPIFKGDIRIREGRILLAEEFAVEAGSYISNESTTEFNPNMDIRLRTVQPLRAVPLRDGNTADLDIILTYHGKLSNPNFELRAEPLNTSTIELPTQEEILAMLWQRVELSVELPLGGVSFDFEPYSRHISVEYQLPRNMLLKFERDRHEGYGVDFQFEGRF